MDSNFVFRPVLAEPPRKQPSPSLSEEEEDEEEAQIEGPGFTSESYDLCITNLQDTFDPHDDFWD